MRYFFFGFRRPFGLFFEKRGSQFAPPPHKKTRINSKHTQHPSTNRLFKTKNKNGLSRSRTKEKVGSGAVGGGEIETTEHALVRAIVRHGVLREPRREAGKRRGEEEGWGRVKCILKER